MISPDISTPDWVLDKIPKVGKGWVEDSIGDGVVVQALDRDGCVILEMASSRFGIDAARDAAFQQMPPGGRVAVVSPDAAMTRRISGMN